jgi:hypothetical protein
MRALLPAIFLAIGCAAPRPAFQDAQLDTFPGRTGGQHFRFSRDGKVAAYVRYGDPRGDCAVVNRIVVGKPLHLI